MNPTVLPAVKAAQQRLTPVSETSGLDAQVLLAHVLARPRAWVLAHPEAPLTSQQAQTLERLLDRLLSGEPLPYVLGHWEFYGLDFVLTPQVLIPRPETELMVERAIAWLQAHPGRRWAADVGTGSGCIAVSIAVAVFDLHLLATDHSFRALKVAQSNVLKHGVVGRVACVQSDLMPKTSRPFDLICANLPYIPSEALQKLEVYRREPTLALDGGAAGLTLIRRLINLAPRILAPGGLLLLEIEASQGGAVQELLGQILPGTKPDLLTDLAGRDRLVAVEAPFL
jgi:release factor glutamine methyltransferase